MYVYAPNEYMTYLVKTELINSASTDTCKCP